ncbi:hypothetical protein TRFO_41687 [Tritrichomonas foetus]|uniref:Uncharacterized protein n=1 Tax=Tritrichomonas foetus TaxID=1144522 RepID=A0A1J4KZC3_9EUKA|nr:hypothetical protein TRFO_41687 [Tritrichomonas foetus]|eukprot:OHT16607.1 hypothetical protein TRFO_41687 [Tritrichomonas foetus]
MKMTEGIYFVIKETISSNINEIQFIPGKGILSTSIPLLRPLITAIASMFNLMAFVNPDNQGVMIIILDKFYESEPIFDITEYLKQLHDEFPTLFISYAIYCVKVENMNNVNEMKNLIVPYSEDKFQNLTAKYPSFDRNFLINV